MLFCLSNISLTKGGSLVLQRLRRRLHSGRGINPSRIVAGSFVLVIFMGALLLSLPLATKSGESVGFLTALFTSTSATCVTGLVLVDTYVTWNLFGQAVLLVLIQLGGLGFMTVLTMGSLALHRGIGLSQRLLMVSTLNLNSMDGVVRVVRHALLGTCIVEGVGAVVLSTFFIPRLGFAEGIWYGVFHSVSAFCNAGFDLMGQSGEFSSLTTVSDQPVILLTIMTLIVLGGLGFVVWEDIIRNRRWKNFSLYTKMVLAMTVFLVMGGAAILLVVENGNPATLGDMPTWEKVLNVFFQSITLRTAGFNTIDQAGLRDSSQVLCILLMLIGGSSGSTAGGLKTATVAVLVLALGAGFRGSEEVTLRGRAISNRRVMNALTLFLTVVVIFLISSMALSFVDELPYLKSAYEVASAMGTVGLTAGLTTHLSAFSQGLIILLMYTGRVGLMSFSIAFLYRSRFTKKVSHPTFDIMIG